MQNFPNKSPQPCQNSFHVGALYKKDKNRKNYVHMFLCNILKDGFFFVHIVQRRKLVRYPGCQRVFFPVVCLRIRDRDEREKNPLVTTGASSLNFRRKQQEKKLSGTQVRAHFGQSNFPFFQQKRKKEVLLILIIFAYFKVRTKIEKKKMVRKIDRFFIFLILKSASKIQKIL